LQLSNSNILIFENPDFGRVRTTEIDGEPWFVGKDVADILGYTNASKALLDHVDSEDKLNNETLASLGQRGGWLINESGLYSLILSSKLPKAKQFKRWVTREVLPIIRKSGGYINNSDLIVSTYFPNVSQEQKVIIKSTFDQITNLQNENLELRDKNEILNNENDLLSQEILEWADRDIINALVRRYGAYHNNNFGKVWNLYKQELLYKYGINIGVRKAKYCQKTGRTTKPRTLDMIKDSELPQAISTIVAMCRELEIDIDDILNNQTIEKIE